jgi:hypothetical protein
LTVPGGRPCGNCGSIPSPGDKFCPHCGTPLAGSSAVTAAVAPTAPTVPLWQRPEFWPDVQQRARRQALPLVVVLLVGFLDFQLHAQAPVALLIIAIGAGVTLFFREIFNWLMSRPNLQQIGSLAQPLFFAVPAAVFFFARGKGDILTSSDAFIISGSIIGVPLLLNSLAPQLDLQLRPFYDLRDRYIPAHLRPVVLIGLALVVTFGIIHGDLTDVKVLFGAKASRAVFPTLGGALSTAVVNILLAYAFLRQPVYRQGGP